MKKFAKYIILLIFMIVVAFAVCGNAIEVSQKYQYLNSIDYYVEMHEDGSMRVTETWDVYVKNTNTLFKSFTLDQYKYGDITNVKVIDLQNGKELTQIYQEMYHVTKDCYYGLKTGNFSFEIAWGVGMDKTEGNRKFQISYTINDVVTDYKDAQEIYWKFIEEGKNAVPAEKVTGTVVLPKSVGNIDNLKVWGHGQLNGTIERTSNNTVKFEMDNLNAGAMLEIRIVTPEKMFNVSENKIKQYQNLTNIINEEQEWADEANDASRNARIVLLILGIIYLLFIIYFIRRIVKDNKINKQQDDGIVYNDIQYFRDIPRDDATPAEACYLYKFTKDRLNTKEVQNNAVSSIILDLCLKKIISLRPEEKEVYVKILGDKQGLQKDEQEVYDILYNAGQNREEFPISDLNSYANHKYNEYSLSINKMVNSTRNRLYDLKLIDKNNEKQYLKYKNAKGLKNLTLFVYVQAFVVYLVSLLFKIGVALSMGMGFQAACLKFLLFLLPLIAVATYSWNLRSKLSNKIAVLTQEGADEKAKWIGLSNYMKDYSLLKEKEVPDLVLWEKYLVYATAFGISDKVIEQMKASYPEVFVQESWDNGRIEQYPIIYFSTYSFYHNAVTVNTISNITRNVGSAYNNSLTQIAAHSHSSGGGRRRRILWRRRWPEEVVAGMGGR